MADTRILKTKVEDNVRTWLKEKFGQPFTSQDLTLTGVQGPPRSTNSMQSRSEDLAGQVPLSTVVSPESRLLLQHSRKRSSSHISMPG